MSILRKNRIYSEKTDLTPKKQSLLRKNMLYSENKDFLLKKKSSGKSKERRGGDGRGGVGMI